jgi:hypothetical protein
VPSRGTFIRRGMIGFTLVSIAGFIPWAVFGKWFRGHGGEIMMYVVCALVFLALSGLWLHRLILGSGSRVRFYKLFTVAFTAYAVAWIVGWMSLRGHAGSFVGLLAGTGIMGWIISAAFGSPAQRWKIIAALFLCNAVGYFLGGVIEGALVDLCECSGGTALTKPTQLLIAKLQWGVCYGLGLGAGLGLAFYWAQQEARQTLNAMAQQRAS